MSRKDFEQECGGNVFFRVTLSMVVSWEGLDLRPADHGRGYEACWAKGLRICAGFEMCKEVDSAGRWHGSEPGDRRQGSVGLLTW